MFSNDLPENPVPTNEHLLADRAETKVWKERNNQAAALIYSMCEDGPAESIEDEEAAMNRWIRLQTDYTDTGFVLRFTKLQELWNTTLYSSNSSVESYIANLRAKSEDLRTYGGSN